MVKFPWTYFVWLDDVVKESVPGGHLDGRVDALLALKVLDDEAVVGVGDLGVVAAPLLEEDFEIFANGLGDPFLY